MIEAVPELFALAGDSKPPDKHIDAASGFANQDKCRILIATREGFKF